MSALETGRYSFSPSALRTSFAYMRCDGGVSLFLTASRILNEVEQAVHVAVVPVAGPLCGSNFIVQDGHVTTFALYSPAKTCEQAAQTMCTPGFRPT